ncbi:steroid receptor RNA activator 1 [Periophthalmus magnuspinnatus]|uniref:steroid receptor RNA activator 1 n=1 Tax=Periophthalmus magnuspinnatus TaxID=409849 RepID=UPI0024372B3B|nr:steroid receptor RNA activator 1 [Periophthalmus magnuspinnatus]
MDSNPENLFIKPGNQERGWNDPPQFSYGLQTSRGAHRNLLTKRAPPAGTPPMTPPTTPPTSALTPPRSAVAPPPFSPAPPPIGSPVVPPPASGPIRAQSDSVQSEREPEVEEVMSVLNAALEACHGTTSVQVCADVGKRLQLLETSWSRGRLSSTVKRRMKRLTTDLRSGLWDSADEAHRSLMVDHVTEVSQWMVGVKRLIAETRKLSPDQLRPLTRGLDRDRDQDPNPDPERSDPDQDQTQDPGQD